MFSYLIGFRMEWSTILLLAVWFLYADGKCSYYCDDDLYLPVCATNGDITENTLFSNVCALSYTNCLRREETPYLGSKLDFEILNVDYKVCFQS